VTGNATQTVSIVMPACNEEEAVRLLSERLYPVLGDLARRHTVELVLVDDGSRDATWAELTRLRDADAPCKVTLARHDVNRGLGAALRTGCLRATGQVIVTLDADGTYPFAIIEPLVTAISAGADIATASPYHRAGGVEGVSASRLIFSRGASAIYRVLVDWRVATYTAMVRAYRADVLRAAISDNDGFLHVAMTLVEARRRGAYIVEVPAVLAQRQVGVSKAKIWRITRAHLRYMTRLVVLRAVGRFSIAPAEVDAPAGAELASHG
jgi:dolichol-phosphate mannosyltransferase